MTASPQMILKVLLGAMPLFRPAPEDDLDERIRVLAPKLQGWSLQELDAAMDLCARRSEWYPTLAELERAKSDWNASGWKYTDTPKAALAIADESQKSRSTWTDAQLNRLRDVDIPALDAGKAPKTGEPMAPHLAAALAGLGRSILARHGR